MILRYLKTYNYRFDPDWLSEQMNSNLCSLVEFIRKPFARPYVVLMMNNISRIQCKSNASYRAESGFVGSDHITTEQIPSDIILNVVYFHKLYKAVSL